MSSRGNSKNEDEEEEEEELDHHEEETRDEDEEVDYEHFDGGAADSATMTALERDRQHRTRAHITMMRMLRGEIPPRTATHYRNHRPLNPHDHDDDEEEVEEEEEEQEVEEHEEDEEEEADNDDDEEEDDENQDDDIDNEDAPPPTSSSGSAYERLFRQILESTFSSSSTPTGSGPAPRNIPPGLLESLFSNRIRSTTTSSGTSSGTSNLVQGKSFFDSIAQKREDLFNNHADDLLGPIAASGNFLMRPIQAHVPSPSQLRLNNSVLDNPFALAPMAKFWYEYEDSLDDAVLLMAKHELRKEENIKKQKNNMKMNKNNNNNSENDDQLLQEEASTKSDMNHESPTTPRHGNDDDGDNDRKNKPKNNNNNNINSVSVTPVASENNNNNNNENMTATEQDYSPWAGPSPSIRERQEQEREQEQAQSNPMRRKIRIISKTVLSQKNRGGNMSDCISFLRKPPPLLPSTCRGSMNEGQNLQPISGFSLSSCDAVAYGDSVLFAMGSRTGSVALGAFQPAHWKAMMMMNSRNQQNNSSQHVDPNSNQHHNQDAADDDDDDDEDDDPEFAQMGRRNNSNRNRTSTRNTNHHHYQHQQTSSSLNFPIQHMETIRRAGAPIFDTAWHPTIPMYAVVGGLPEMILGFAGGILRDIYATSSQQNDPNNNNNFVGSAQLDADQEENDPIMGRNILPRVAPPPAGSPNPQQQQQKQKRARNLIVDVNNEDAFRSYTFGVDFFGHHSVVCGCSGGAVSTIAIRPDGQFVVRPLTIHTDDVNTVCRFGRDPESPLFVSGADDRRVALSDSRVPEGHVAYGKGHTLGLMSVTARKDDYFFASVGKDQVVKLWDIRKLSTPASSMGMRRGNLARSDRDEIDDDRFAVRWNHYNSPETAPPPMQTRGDQSALSMPNSHRFVYTLCRARFSPFSTTGGRYLLAGGCGGAQIFDIVSGGVVSNLVWNDAGSADEVMRDIAWIDETCVMACSQTTAFVFSSGI